MLALFHVVVVPVHSLVTAIDGSVLSASAIRHPELAVTATATVRLTVDKLRRQLQHKQTCIDDAPWCAATRALLNTSAPQYCRIVHCAACRHCIGPPCGYSHSPSRTLTVAVPRVGVSLSIVAPSVQGADAYRCQPRAPMKAVVFPLPSSVCRCPGASMAPRQRCPSCICFRNAFTGRCCSLPAAGVSCLCCREKK